MGDMVRRADRGIIPVLGNLSYSIYMIHVPLQISLLLFMDLFVGRDRSFAESPYTLPSYLLLTILLAFLIYRHFERPMDRAIRRVCLQGSTRDMQRQTGLVPNEAIPITKADNKEQT